MDVFDDESGSAVEESTVRRQAPEGRNSRLVAILTVVGFGLPIAGYFWLLNRYSLNVIVGDQWDDVRLVGLSYAHLFDWSSLWAQHNENRIFFPNLIVLTLAHTTHLNVQLEEYLSAVMLTGSTALLIWAHKRRSPSTRWLYYCPVAILMLSFVQHQNTLQAFQLSWYLVLLAVAVTVVLLDRWTLTWWVLGAAMASAVVASYSSLQGLIVWPVGLMLLYYRRRRGSFIIAWISATLVTTVIYFTNFVSQSEASGYVVRHPIVGLKFFVVAVGDVVGVNLATNDSTEIGVLLFGILIVIASIWVLIAYCSKRDELSGMPIAAVLITFGFLFAALVTDGRVPAGLTGASQSRYRTFDLLILVGLYLIVVDQWVLRRRAKQIGHRTDTPGDAIPEGLVAGATYGERHPRSFVVLAVIVVAAVCLQIGIGIPEGLAGARSDHAAQVQAARVVVNINRYPNVFVSASMEDAYLPADFVRRMADVARMHRLSLFATGAVAEYRSEGLITSTLSTSITVPVDGSVLTGKAYLSAIASDSFGVSKVEFDATGVGMRSPVVIQAVPYAFGWLGIWHTQSVPNGRYLLESIASTAAGLVEHSRGVTVTIKN